MVGKMRAFLMNGIRWRISFVNPRSPWLVDRTNQLRVATTDPETRTIYLSTDLEGSFLDRVLLHELGHCVLFSFGLIDEIRKAVKPEYWIEAEEWICNFVADYGRTIMSVASDALPHRSNYNAS